MKMASKIAKLYRISYRKFYRNSVIPVQIKKWNGLKNRQTCTESRTENFTEIPLFRYKIKNENDLKSRQPVPNLVPKILPNLVPRNHEGKNFDNDSSLRKMKLNDSYNKYLTIFESVIGGQHRPCPVIVSFLSGN